MKTQKFLAAAAAVIIGATAFSCSNDKSVTNDPIPVKFSSAVEANQTRVAIDDSGNSVWDTGDGVVIYMVDHGNHTYSDILDKPNTRLYKAVCPLLFPLQKAHSVTRWTKLRKWILSLFILPVLW